jgi:hypothetical protein
MPLDTCDGKVLWTDADGALMRTFTVRADATYVDCEDERSHPCRVIGCVGNSLDINATIDGQLVSLLVRPDSVLQ